MTLTPAFDEQVKQSLKNFQDGFSKSTPIDEVRQHVISTVCQLTRSPIGFILEKCFDGENTYLECRLAMVQDTEAVWQKIAVPGRVKAKHPQHNLYELLQFSRNEVLDQQSLNTITSLTASWPELKCAIAMPLGTANQPQQIIFVANAPHPYHIDIVKNLWPVFMMYYSQLLYLNNQQSSELRKAHSTENNADAMQWRSNFFQLKLAVSIPVISLDQDERIISINHAAETLLDRRSKELIKCHINEVLIQPNVIKGAVLNSGKNDDSKTMQQKAVKTSIKGAKNTILSVHLSALNYQDGQLKRTVLFLNPLTEDLNAYTQAALLAFQHTANNLPLGILQTDHNWHTDYVNSKFQELCQLGLYQLNGLSWNNIFHPDEVEEILAQLHDKMLKGESYSVQCQIQQGDEPTWMLFQATPNITTSGEIKGFIATLADYSEQHNAEEKLRILAENDPLTGLANRSQLYDRLSHALERIQRHGPLALLALDLDGFKQINDSLGHDAGDLLLVEVAKRLTSCVRSEDTVARVGGDEFLIILEDIKDALNAANLCEKILKELSAPFHIQRREIFISTSIGLSFAVTGNTSSAKNLMKQADLALYLAKDNGRNNYQYYSPDLEQISRRRLELGNALHRALERREFTPFYQLQLNIATGKVCGFEALLRWRHPTLGMLSPDEFIPILEDAGLIASVFTWMCRQSFQQMHQWIDHGLVDQDCVMSVNVSPRQFYDNSLVASVKECLLWANLPGSNVVIEVTETLLIQDHSATRDTLYKLKDMGVKVALDDFGTGYSSLSYLKKFPIDVIKIDRSFIQDILTDKEDSAITQAVIALALTLKLKVVAEGVENREILQQLALWKCDECQGYYLNRPMPANEVTALLPYTELNNLTKT